MPRTNLFSKQNKYDKLVALIRGTADVQGKSLEDIGNIIGRQRNTITARMQHPEKFTLEELSKIGRGLNIPIEDIRQCVRY